MFNRSTLLIELGGCHVKVGVANYSGGVVQVQDAFIVDLPQQTYVDGKILDFEVLRSRIFNSLQDRSIKVKDTYLTLNGSHVITREIVLPDVHDDELDEMITYEIQQYMPINLDQFHIEYKVLERFEEAGHVKIRILVAGVSKEDVESYYKLLMALQLKPVVMDINGNAISKLFQATTVVNSGESLGNKKIALIDLGRYSLNVTIVENGVMHLSRLVEADENELEPFSSDEIYDNQDLLTTLTGRVQRVFQFYASRHSGSKIDQIYLLGGYANNLQLVNHFCDVFELPVEVVSNLSTVSLTGKAKTIDMKRYLNMLGSLARDKQVN